MKAKIYIFHSDPGHGWLAVKRKELKDLGIFEKVSGYSYQRGQTVYLEEDCDASLFLNAKKKANKDMAVATRDSFQENTPIRGYENFHFTPGEVFQKASQ
jgi:hypothetical protein